MIDTGALTSSGLLQRHLPDAHVVKVFNNIYYRHLASLARPSGAPDRTALPIAGDDAAAKAAVTAYLDSIGYDSVDAGTLADSWHQEPGHPGLRRPVRPLLLRDRLAGRAPDRDRSSSTHCRTGGREPPPRPPVANRLEPRKPRFFSAKGQP